MVITPKQVKNLSYVIVDDLYSAVEVEQIKEELRDLIPFLQKPSNTKVAVDENNTPKKKAMGVFLDEHYEVRDKSAILTLNRRLFCDEIVQASTEFNQYFNGIRQCSIDTTLVNYYSNDGKYEAHKDDAMLTAITFFQLGEITGGDVSFTEVGATVPFKENRVVIFPGCAMHKAEATTAEDGSFRVSIAQFLNYRY